MYVTTYTKINMMIFIDLFCGAGGVTTGIERAKHNKNKSAKVIACVNHDAMAIKSHAYNHKKVLHFVEDIRTLDLTQLRRLVDFNREKYPQAAFAIWASLECTNFSRAKGGKPRDGDSRTLAEHLERYIDVLGPEYVFIENVTEFMSWGPLDENGKPISKREGVDYLKWRQNIESMGFRYDHRILNAADYGAHTKRERYFAQFAKGDLPIHWPAATHAKKASEGMFGALKRWNPVKEVLDFTDEGNSIFGRKKDLSDKTMGRVYAGLIKYVAGGNKSFITKWNSNNAKTGVNAGSDINEPCPVVTTQNRLGLVQTEFLYKYYGNGHNLSSIEEPAGTLTTKDRMVLVSPKWLDLQFSSGKRDQSLEEPAGAILTVPKMNLVSVKKHYMTNPQWNSSTAQSVDEPCFTLIARMDKAPPSLITTEPGKPMIEIKVTDTETIKKIKAFMLEYGIVDIKMRMLKVPELLKIQGFPKNYYLAGTQADQKKFIGNSVCPAVAEALIRTSSLSFVNHQSLKQAA